MGLAEGSSVDGVEVELLGAIAERDTRPLGVAVLLGVMRGHTEEDVNEVNAPAIAGERGIVVEESKRTIARDFENLVRVTVVSGEARTRVVGTILGRRNRPHLLEAWGQRFNIQFEDYIALFRYHDQPGMIGRVGTAFGRHGINIDSAAVGHVPEGNGGEDLATAVMVVTSQHEVPQDVLREILAGGDFLDARAVALRE